VQKSRRLILTFVVTAVALTGMALLSCDAGWCTTVGQSTLCDDFDRGHGTTQEDLLAKNFAGGAGGSIALNTDTVYTPPYSALATSNAFEGGVGGGAVLLGSLGFDTQPVSTITCSFEIQALQLATVNNDAATVFALTIADGKGVPWGRLRFDVQTDGSVSLFEEHPPSSDAGSPGSPGAGSDAGSDAMASAADAATAGDAASGPAPALASGYPTQQQIATPTVGTPSSWSQLKLSLTTSGATTSFSATVDDVGVSGVLQQPLPATLAVSVALGPVDTGPSSDGWSFFFDNILCQ
jgi:hypothetical protein